MSILKDKTCRGELINTVVEHSVIDNMYSFGDIKEIIQKRLDANLNFETKVSDLEIKDNNTFGNISFIGEEDEIRVVDFTIIV